MAPILHLPPEITGYIINRLSPNDILCLRQTCHTLNNKTLHIFTQNYFSMRRVMLERRSLETLASISEHPTLGPSIKEVEISTNHLLPLNELHAIKPPTMSISETVAMIERRGNSQPEESEEEDEEEDEENASSEEADSSDADYYPHLRRLNERAYRKAFNNQEELIRQGDDIRYLTQAMKNLINCKAIRITDSNRVWGMRRLRREIGILPQRCLTFESLESVQLVRRMLHALFTALAESNASIELLEVATGCCVHHANRISPDILVRPSSTTLDQFRLSTLTALSLKLDSKSPEHNALSTGWTYDLIQFVKRFPELSYLEIDFENRDESTLGSSGSSTIRPSNFSLVARTTYTRFPKLSQLLYIPKLEELRLGMLDCTSMELAFFLLRHQKTLKVIHLESIILVDDVGGWPWLVELVQDNFHQITRLIMHGCMTHDSHRAYPESIDEHYYYDPALKVLKVTDSKGP